MIALRPIRSRTRALCATQIRSYAAGPRKLRLSLGAGCIPKVDGQKGEDAFFAALPISAFGLADGVGGWADRGVDAGLFSRALLESALQRMRQRANAMQRPDLPGVASEAFQAVREKSLDGSCTLLLGQMQQDMFTLLNLGDCGLMALRPCSILPRFHGGTVTTSMRLIYRSTPMLHRTNLPLQLSSQDPNLSSLTEYFDLVTLKLRKGDVLIAGTDGLFDNIGDLELKSLALSHHESRTASGENTTQDLADALLARAAEVARAPMEFGPGGKLDDIAVVLAEVRESSPTTQAGLLSNLVDVDG
mmetsp:Transcript_41034/g.76311  ORF Transcript_41034/g.76311 Transcript_41034/m.76311 type:complete len:304 (+) Transcript_41034:49-960(+)